jgi:hypothetical protein
MSGDKVAVLKRLPDILMQLKPAAAIAAIVFAVSSHVAALSMAPEEFHASRQLACVLALESLGRLSEQEYSEKTHTLLDGYSEDERSTILAKAVGYYDGLMFSLPDNDANRIRMRLQDFVDSATCADSPFRRVTLQL